MGGAGQGRGAEGRPTQGLCWPLVPAPCTLGGIPPERRWRRGGQKDMGGTAATAGRCVAGSRQGCGDEGAGTQHPALSWRSAVRARGVCAVCLPLFLSGPVGLGLEQGQLCPVFLTLMKGEPGTLAHSAPQHECGILRCGSGRNTLISTGHNGPCRPAHWGARQGGAPGTTQPEGRGRWGPALLQPQPRSGH